MIRLAKLLSRKILFKNYSKKFVVDKLKMTNGISGEWAYVDCTPGVTVVALDKDQNLILVSQYRYTTKSRVTENVAGGIEFGDDPLLTAQKELIEESGYQSETFIDLGQYYDLPNETNHFCTIFLALNCHQISLPTLDSDGEKYFEMKVEKHPFMEIYNSLGTPSCLIKSSEHTAAIFLAHRYLSSHHLL